MKKIIAILFAVLLTCSICFAQEESSSSFSFDLDFGVSLKGGVAPNLGSSIKLEGLPSSYKNKTVCSGIVGLAAPIGVFNAGPGKIGIQPEVNYFFSNGAKAIWDDGINSGSAIVKTSTLDITALVFYNIKIEKVNGLAVVPFLGPQVSIPMYMYSSLDTFTTYGTKTTTKRDYSAKSLTYGMDIGCELDYVLGPGAVLFDLRYFMDFNPTEGFKKNVKYELLRRGALGINLGYKFTL